MTALPPPLQAERLRLTEGNAALRKAYEATPSPLPLLRGRAQLVDDATRSIWTLCAMPSDSALVAVGGYGRGMLFPHSDVDLLILLPAPADQRLQERLSALIGALWDIGLEVGHSVRTIEHCLEVAQTDIAAQTCLLEARLLTGNTGLFEAFTTRYRAALDPRAFFKAKELEQEQRYARSQDSPFSLEPNCKESPGGLRDLQILNWIARAAQLGDSWRDLAQIHLTTTAEAKELREAELFLQHLRIRLHYLTGRAEDRLLFEYQEKLAQLLKIKAHRGRRAAEVFMRRYYITAKKITQINTVLLSNYHQVIFPYRLGSGIVINPRFQSVRELLDIRDEELFQYHPSALFECFLLLQKRTELKGMTARTLRALWAARHQINAAFRGDKTNQALFIEILRQKRRIAYVLRLMNQYDILPRYLPAWGKIVGQMQYDLFHAYTVDEHSLLVLRNLRHFTLGEHGYDYPIMTRLMLGFGPPLTLYVAALFHDIAKGRGGNHSELGMVDARQFCEQHQLSHEDTALIVWLVQHHLVMSQVAQKEDITDPDIIRRFADIVGNERCLIGLYLLTHADIRGTSPKVWNGWKGRLLEDLFLATQRMLRGATPEQAVGLKDRREDARHLLRYHGLRSGVEDALWNQLDSLYFMRHSADEIAWHTRQLYFRPSTTEPVVKARIAEGETGIQIMVFTHDHKDLFVRLTGFFGRRGFSILDAKVHTTHHGYALDSFIIQDSGNTTAYRDIIALIEHELSTHLTSGAPPERPRRNRESRQHKHFPLSPQVKIRAAEATPCYILSLTAADRPGLLFDVAQVLAGHNIALLTAKIATFGERVEDTFMIQSDKLTQDTNIIRLKQDLLERLQA